MFSPAGLQRPPFNPNPNPYQAPQGMPSYQMPPNFLSQGKLPEQQEKKQGIFSRVFSTAGSALSSVDKFANIAKNLAIAGGIGFILIGSIFLWRNFANIKTWVSNLGGKEGLLNTFKDLINTGRQLIESFKTGGVMGLFKGALSVSSALAGQKNATSPVIK